MQWSTDIQTLAATAYEWFEVARRDSNDPDSGYVRVKDGAPEWVTDIVRAAHGDFLPDDWRYDKIQDALEYISEADDPDDSGEFADSAVDVYTTERVIWLGSNINRAGYCDEAIGEFGNVTSIVDLIGRGQYVEATEIYGQVLRALEDSAVSVEP